MNKKISFSIATTIIIILAVLVGGFAVWQYLKIPKEIETSEIKLPEKTQSEKTQLEDETADLSRDEVLRDWKTYRSEEYGFQVKYPSKWGLEISPDVRHPYIEGIDIIQPYNEVYKPGSYVGKDLNFFVISSSLVNIDNIIKNNKAEEIDLGNVMAWRYERQIGGPETMVLTEEVTLIPAKDFYIEISELANYGPEDYNYRSRTISNILSTFRFLE